MAIEDTMAQLAHSQVTQSLPSMSGDLQGFQLIYSNEDINSAVGVIVAVVNDLVVYVPAVYRKGKIYNMDIMYIPEMRQWLPTQDNWVTYIRSRRADVEAVIEKRDVMSRSGGPASVDLDTPLLKIVKHASGIATTGADIERYGMPTVLQQAADFMEKALETPVKDLNIPSATTLLKHAASSNGAQRLIDSIAEHPSVANAFAQFYTDADMLDVVTAVDNANKVTPGETSSRVDGGEVRVITAASTEAKSLTDAEKVAVLKDGAVIRDTRGLVPTKIYKTKSRGSWGSPSDNGIYELLKLDGGTLTALVVVSRDKDSRVKPVNDKPGRVVVIPLDDGKAHTASYAPDTILGQRIPVNGFTVTGGRSIDNLVENTCTVALDLNGAAVFINHMRPTYVGVGKDTIVMAGNATVGAGVDCDFTDSSERLTKLVKIPARGKLRVSEHTLYVPETTMFFEVPPMWDSELNPLKLATSDEYLDTISRREKLLSIKLYNTGDTIVVSDDRGGTTEPLSKRAAAYELVKNYIVPADIAMQMVKEASESKQVRYLAKIAASSALSAIMSNGDSSQTNVEQIDLNGKTSSDPRMDIVEAANTGVKEVMDVSVLQILADDGSSVRMIQDLIPQLFGAMNAVGQLLFMLRASTSMTDAYGESRSTEMEQQFAVLMQRLGDAVIALQRGRIDDISDLLEGKLSATLG